MPGWRPLPRIAFAICVYPFQPSSPADLPLEIGDELYIIEQGGKDGSWYRGYLVAPPSLLAGLTSVKGQTLEARVFSGIFPRCCVEVRELLGEGKNGTSPTDGTDKQRGSLQEPTTNGSSATPDAASRASAAYGRLSFRRHSQKLDGHASQRTTRPDHLQQPILPLSPGSISSRDPTAPRPPAPVPMLKIGDETPTSTQEPLVDEIASCLREWHSTKLHELLLARRYSTLDKMWTLVQRLDTARRQLLHKVLTAQELRRLRELTVWDLVSGNKTLCGEVIVRSPLQRGRILTADDSAIEITKLQSMMSLLDERPLPHTDEHNLHHLFIHMKTIVGDFAQVPAQVSMHLCLKLPGSPPRPLSEVYSLDLTNRDGAAITLTGEKMKALFVDLSATDIGEGVGSGSSLFLVFKLYATEPHKSSSSPNLPRNSTSSNNPPLQSSQFGSIKGGRRSVMFGSKQRKEHTHPNHGSEARPGSIDSNTSPSQEGRPTSAAKGKSISKDAKPFKRTVAVGLLRVDALLRGQAESEQDVVMWSPKFDPEEISEEQDVWDNLLNELFPSPTGRYQKSSLVQRLAVQLKGFTHPDADLLVEKTPTLLHNVKQARKIGFSGAPTKPRSDIYLTLVEPFLPNNAFLSHPKSGSTALSQVSASAMSNLQLTLEVRKSSGERIDGSIYPSANSAGHTAWRTTAVERGEHWNTSIRLAIDPEDVPGSHIVMSIADAPGFPFALCWMPLWTQDAFVRDGDHSLALYKYDEYTSSMISGKGAYLSLPWSSQKKDESVVGPMAALRLRTYLCSTKYSQDPNLLGLLKWREQAAGELVALLRRFVFVPEIEIVKLLNEVFDALFQILVEYAGSDEYEDLVFNALVIVLGIVHDRRFNLGPLVDHYAETAFNYPFATSCLVRSYTRLLSNPADPESSRRLRATFKVGSHILKFIVNARHQQKEKEAGIGITNRQPNFTRDLHAIFKLVEALMINPAPLLIGTKTIVVQQFHLWLPELSSCLSPMEILNLASSFIDSCATAQGKLILYKLVLVKHMADLDIFRPPNVRKVLLKKTIQWLCPHWGKATAVTNQWREQVRLCCSVIASQVEDLGEGACEYIPKLVDSYRALQSLSQTPKTTLSLLFPSSYPFPTRPVSTAAVFDEALIEISAVLAAMSDLPTIIHLDWPKPAVAEFLFSALQVYISILDCGAFPSTWLSVHIYQHKATLRMLEKLASVLIDSFLPHPDEADKFNTELWRAFFDALLKLVGSNALELETFPEQKRRAVWKIAGDIRELGADLLRRTWDAIGWETSPEDRDQYGLDKMGGFQVQYVPGLVTPIVELCLSVHEGLRSVAIEVLRAMIVSEWTLSEDLSLIQAEMIDCLDRLFKSKNLTESLLQKFFIGELLELFAPQAQESENGLFSAVKNLITIIDELLDLLVAVHSIEDTGEVFHIMDTLHLMEFLKDMQKEDIYIRYVHQLVELQANAHNFTEAGLALRLHAELYDWGPMESVEALYDPHFPKQTAFERKEQLYFQMIRYYEDGQSWENALGAYMELATQYEHNIFDFAKLARTQHAIATIYESISKGDRQNPRYFRVVYKGLGFPVGLRDKQFIFEASPSERLATFTDRMQQQHPSAQILAADNEGDLEGQYLQIFPVSPQKNLQHPIYQRAKVTQPIKDYYLLSRPSNFVSPSRRPVGDATGKFNTVEKTVYTTAEAFPTILRRSEVVSVATITLTPLETAIERTARKLAELSALERRVADGEDSAMTPLAQELTLAVDPSSEVSVAKYNALLPNPRDSSDEDEVEGDQEPNVLEKALKVALTDYALLVRRCLSLFSRPAQQATRAELTQRFEISFTRELATLLPIGNGQIGPATEGQWLPSAAASLPIRSQPSPPIPRPSGDKARPPPPDRGMRQDKKRLSLAFFKDTSAGKPPQESQRFGGRAPDDEPDSVSNTESSLSKGKDNHKHRLSFLNSAAVVEPVPPPVQISKQQTPVQEKLSQAQSIEVRPVTSKSETSDQQSVSTRKGSVRKRLSLLHIGKKSSKNSVKGQMADTLVEE